MSHFVFGAIERISDQTTSLFVREDLRTIASRHQIYVYFLDELPLQKDVHDIVQEQHIGIGKLDICFLLVRSREDDTSDQLIDTGTVSEPAPIPMITEQIGGFYRDAHLRYPDSSFVLGITEGYGCAFHEIRATPTTVGIAMLAAYDAEGFYWPSVLIRTAHE